MKTLFMLFGFLLILSTVVFAAEDLTLTAPVTKPSIAKWRVQQITIVIFPVKSVSLSFYDPDHPGDPDYSATCVWDANSQPTAATIISTLNTANLTSNSLAKRATTAAQALGCIGAGTVAGTPE